MKISQQFAPPFKLIAPFFISAIIVFSLCSLFLFNIDLNSINSQNLDILAFVHLFLLGFAMMTIFGAMAQLVPVILEVEHFAVELYYAVYPLLFIGTILMVIGFYSYPILLSFGGLITFISFLIFICETFLTLFKVKKIKFISLIVLFANLFLFFGVVVGFLMALAYGGFINIDLDSWLKVHIYFVLFGYVGFTIMGLSYVLIPMFWLSHGFDDRYLKYALIILATCVIALFFAELFSLKTISSYIDFFILISFLLYFYQLIIIYKKRVRKQRDIYFIYLAFFIIGIFLSLLIACLYLYFRSDKLFLIIGFLAMYSIISPLILGHFYKIVPFLIWFQKFSPLVGKQKVPMLSDMVPNKSASFALFFNIIASCLIFFALIFNLEILLKAGASFMFISSIFLLKDILYMINFKG